MTFNTVGTPVQPSTAKETAKPKKNIKGTLAAIGAGTAAQAASSLPSLLSLKGMTSISHNLPKDQVEIVNKAADDIVENVTNLGKKGVKIQNYCFGGLNLTGLPDCILELTNPMYATANGKNAAFLNKDLGMLAGKNTVLVNRDKLSLATFHELGHAFNFNNSAFWKTMQKMRTPGMILAIAFALLPALTKEAKVENGEELTKGQKFKNGLRKASPALAFASMLPMLAEEGMASIRGCKWTKQLLDKNLFKKVLKTNLIAYTSYLAAALSFAAMAIVAKKVKDNSQEKLETKQPQA